MSDPKPDSKQTDFEQRARTLLRQSAAQTDAAATARLTQARYAAVAALEQSQSKAWYWLPAGVAAGAVAAVLLANQPRQTEPVATTAVDAMEIVTADDSLEFYRDVDFYAWLDTVIEDDAVVPEA